MEVYLAVGGGGGEVGHNVAEFDCHLLKRGSGHEPEVRDNIKHENDSPVVHSKLLLYTRDTTSSLAAKQYLMFTQI